MADASSKRPGPATGTVLGARIRPGTIVLIVGPSGAGKDTLLQGAEDQLSDDPAFHFPRRLINRSAHAAEHHDILCDQQLTGRSFSRTYRLSWKAHGLTYALPATIDDAVREGHCVVFNASRTIIETARQRYQNLRIVYIDAPPEVRAGRLAGRGRETAAEIRDRLTREVATFQPSAADVMIENTAAIENGVAALIAALRKLARLN